MKEYKDNVGQRVLIKWGIRGMIEVRIMEVSPSGERAKIKHGSTEEWIPCFNHDILEILP